MHRRTRTFQFLTVLVFGFTTNALARETSEVSTGDPALSGASSEPGAEAGTTTSEEAVSATPAAPPPDLGGAVYGLAFRARWVMVPSWFLGFFTQKNSPLSSYGWALEGFRRKRDKDDPNRTWELSVGIGYQNMSPPDGFWLGKNKDILLDTDLVQAKNFSLITMDAAFISRQYFSRYFGIHYGAGLGLAVVRGKILRTSAVCNEASGQCHVEIANTCGAPGQRACSETDIAGSEGQQGDAPGNGHRFQERQVPSAIPIINILVGLDFPIPEAKGLEFRLEGGFFNAFFVGAAAGWVF